MADVENFEVDDEIYMSAWDPSIHVLASATWSEKQHPMAWTQPYGEGRVFYTTLGHGPGTFERPMMQKLMQINKMINPFPELDLILPNVAEAEPPAKRLNFNRLSKSLNEA